VQFSELQKLSDLDLDLGSGQSHMDAHIWSRSTHTTNYIEIGKTFVDGQKYVCTDGRTHLSFIRSIRSSPSDGLTQV